MAPVLATNPQIEISRSTILPRRDREIQGSPGRRVRRAGQRRRRLRSVPEDDGRAIRDGGRPHDDVKLHVVPLSMTEFQQICGAIHGPLAASRVDVDLHLLGDFHLVSAALSVGIRLGARLDLTARTYA